MSMLSLILALAVVPALVAHTPTDGQQPMATPLSGAVSLPQCFVEDGDGYLMHGAGLSASLETGRMRWVISGHDEGLPLRSLITMEPVGAQAQVAPQGEDVLPGVVSHFRGAPSAWRAGRRTFATVRYAELWPGIDLILEAKGQTLKGTYTVAPGAQPCSVRMRHHGADAVLIDEGGRLVVQTPAGELVDAAPVAWQQIDGERRDVPVAFALEAGPDGAVDVTFALAEYDHSAELLIDPAVIVQAGFLGGAEKEQAVGVSVDVAGNVYVAGWTRSDEMTFPVLVGPELIWDGAPSATQGDAFVAKLDPTGENLIYAGFIGGTNFDFAQGLAVDSLGRAYVGGHTASNETSGFPVIGGPSTTFSGGNDGWVARVSADGSSLDYCGYIGGNSGDRVFGIDVDDTFRAHVVGRFKSIPATLPLLVGPYLSQPGGSTDSFIARLAPDGLSLEYCGYLGGSSLEDITEVAVDSQGGAWFAGWTGSTDFPIVGPLGMVHSGASDFAVGRVAPDGMSLTASGLFGGASSDIPTSIAVDAAGAAYVAGITLDAPNFPVVVGPNLVPSGTTEGVLMKIAADGQSVVWSGFTGTGISGAMDVEADGTAWVITGVNDGTPAGTASVLATIPPSGMSLDTVATFAPGGETFLGFIDIVPSALTPGVTEVWVAGQSTADEAAFPVVSGPDVTANGMEDVVLLRLQIGDDPWTDLGLARAGTYGDPVLAGLGTLGPLSPFSVVLSNALENTTAYLALGYATLNAPFFGGTLVPDISAPGFFVPFATDGLGQLQLGGTWPAGVPSGFSFYTQFWIADPGASFVPVAASNGLQGTTP